MQETIFRGQIYGNSMKEKIDLVDRKILYVLSNNARFAHVSIAKKLRIKREVVAYRIKKLIERKIINGFFTYINPRRLGFTVIAVCIKLRNIKQKDNCNEKKIVNYLIENTFVTNVKSCSGRYDLLLEVSVREIDYFDNVLNEFLHNFLDYIEHYDIFLYLDSSYLGRGILLDSINDRKQLDGLIELKGSTFSKEFIRDDHNNTFLELNHLDKKILKSIKFDSSKNIIDIAKEVNCSPKTVMSRVRYLVKENVIKQFLPLINLSAFGFHWYTLFLQMVNVDEKKFITFLRMHPNILHYEKYIVRWNYKLNIFVEDNSQFQQIVTELRNVFTDNMAGFDSLIVHNQLKFEQKVE